MSALLPLSVALPVLQGVLAFLSPRPFLAPISAVFGATNLAIALGIFRGTFPAIARYKVERYSLGGWGVPVGIDLRVDGVSAALILLTGIIGFAISVYSMSYFSRSRSEEWDANRGFWPIWFLLWASLNAVFSVADLFSLYVCLELITLSSVALIVLQGDRAARPVALRYLLTSLVASLSYLIGVALVYGETNVLDYEWVSQRIQAGWSAKTALSLMSVGLMTKTAIFPLHFWLPGAHSRAPAPVSAALSALVIKASFYILLRLWAQIFAQASPSVSASHLLGAFGATAILWGSYRAMREPKLKLIVAYSTVAQVGYLFLAFPLLLSVNPEDLAHRMDPWKGTVYFALSHGIAKAALFLVAGVFLHAYGSERINEMKGAAARYPTATLAWGLAGISVCGLPPSGGFVAKWLLLTSAIREQYWGYAAVILVGGVLASGYIFRVLWFAFLTPDEKSQERNAPALQSGAALLLGILVLWMGLRATVPLSVLQVGAPFTAKGGP